MSLSNCFFGSQDSPVRPTCQHIICVFFIFESIFPLTHVCMNQPPKKTGGSEKKNAGSLFVHPTFKATTASKLAKSCASKTLGCRTWWSLVVKLDQPIWKNMRQSSNWIPLNPKDPGFRHSKSPTTCARFKWP